MTSNNFLSRCNFLVATALLCAAPATVRWLLDFATWSGFFSDVFSALLVALLAMHLARKWRAIVLVIWMFMQLGSFMLLASMARLPSWQDLQFVGDGQFVANSMSQISPSHLLYTGIFLLATLLVLLLPKQAAENSMFQSRRAFINALLVLFLAMASFYAQKIASSNIVSGQNLYALFNPLHWLGEEAWQLATQNQQAISAEYMLKQDLSGTPLLPQPGKAKNVLIIAMEGMTGLYLKQARDHFSIATDNPPVLMPKLSKWAEQGMVIPDFVDHTHQTIRGLYSLLCADMDKLSNGTPKAVELQNAPALSARCLPTEMYHQGYSTHFLQGAGLAFMGKDRIMPALGFNYVHGTEWFKGKNIKERVKFGWGMDDRSFFDGSLKYIDELQEQSRKNNNQPWFLTLLTVGTHQPYAIPKNYEKNYKDRRDASVGYIDEGVSSFLEALKKRGLFENTLIIVTSDESHGSDMADWVSAWGIGIVFAPENMQLPKENPSGFAISDMPLSIMDYLGLTINPKMAGRSYFRDYKTPREMASNTAGRLRWLKNGVRYECSALGNCRQCKASSLIGWAECSEESPKGYAEFSQKANWLNGTVKREASSPNVLNFAKGEMHDIKKQWKNAWMDNLIGAQYLDFPANSTTEVNMRWRVINAPKQGGKLTLMLKQLEKDIPEPAPELPVFYTGEIKEFTFTIDNPQDRANFSFHLLPDTPMKIEMLDFVVTVKTNKPLGDIKSQD